MVVRVVCVGVVGVMGVLCIGVLEVDCVGVVDILLLGVVFVVEGVGLVLGCVVRLVLRCVNGRGIFLRCFCLKAAEMNGLSVGGFLFGIVIWVDRFIFLERGRHDGKHGCVVGGGGC